MTIKKTILRPPSANNPQIRSYIEAVQRGEKNIHIIYSKNDWQVKRIGQSPVKVFSTQKDALEYGKKIAKKEKTELFLHGKDGLIRERLSCV